MPGLAQTGFLQGVRSAVKEKHTSQFTPELRGQVEAALGNFDFGDVETAYRYRKVCNCLRRTQYLERGGRPDERGRRMNELAQNLAVGR